MVVDARTGTPRLAVAGGCGSSGTTLLAHLLSRHSRVVSSPELDFFNHPEVLSVETLRASLDALFARRRLSSGYKLVVDFCKPGEVLGIDEKVLARWLAASTGLSDVCAKLSAHVCRARGASWYFEKTPTNVYSFSGLAVAAADVPLIHQIRDGRDVVASLRRRGKSLFYAASRWIYDTNAGLAARGHRSYRELRYEDLVGDPRATLATVLGWLGLEIEESMLNASEAPASYSEKWRERDAPKRWNSVPTDPISSRSVGSFRKELTPEDLSMVMRVRLTDRAAEELRAPVRTFAEMIELLGYDTAGAAPAAAGPIARLRETTAEIVDGIERSRRSWRYTGRLATALTYVSATPLGGPLTAEHSGSR